jgi:peroxiredoxin Q/BCP
VTAKKSESAGPQAGDKAPAFKLQDDSGKTVSLSDFKGRKVVLYFYPKDNTGGCTKQACAFRDGLPKITKSGAVVVGVSADSVESHRKFKDKQKLNFPLISDPDHEALEAYGVWQEKSLYGRKFMGIVRTTFLIDEKGKIAKVFPKVKVDKHFDEVMASL